MNRAVRRLALLLFASAAVAGFSLNARAQDQKPPSLPLPEMQRLAKLYVGTWTYTETYPISRRRAAAIPRAIGVGGGQFK